MEQDGQVGHGISTAQDDWIDWNSGFAEFTDTAWNNEGLP